MFKGNIKKYLPIIIILVAIGVAFGYQRQASALITSTLIGGQTLGVNGVCCNGVKLGFTSVSTLNPNILQGEALWIPLVSKTYDNDNQTSVGYCALGKLFPAVCLTIISECTVSEPIPVITLLGTGGTICALGL